jgi:hypothetical protein
MRGEGAGDGTPKAVRAMDGEVIVRKNVFYVPDSAKN